MRAPIRAGRALGVWIAIGVLGLVAPASASAATTVGQTFSPLTACPAGYTLVQLDPTHTVPSSGVITSWSFRADGSPPPVKLKVARVAGGNDLMTVGESTLETPSPFVLSTFPVRIPVKAGDLLGVYVGATRACAQTVGNYQYDFFIGDPAPGSTATYSPGIDLKLDLSASLEPDADNDGFGDETQDCAPNDALRHDDCSPPETTISKGPKDKAKKRKVTFEFTSDEPGATFECSFDGQGFTPCISPRIETVDKGKHVFQVRATDAAGNVDPTPAVDSWKVKKKKKK